MARFWISWCEPVGDDGDFRPRAWPLPDVIPAYWCSGWAGDNSATLCAVVDAPDAAAAKAEIRALWSPSSWRFIESKPADWRPAADRFPWKEKR